MASDDERHRRQSTAGRRIRNNHPPITLDRVSEVPLYHQLAEHMRMAIKRGSLVRGSRLRNEIDLAKAFGVSRPTTRRAIQELVDQGLLIRKRGVGTQIVNDEIARPIHLSSLYDDLKSDQRNPESKVLLNQVVLPHPAVAAKLLVPTHEPVLHLRRLRMADGEPLAILDNFLPYRLRDVGNTDLSVGSLYHAMRAAGVRMKVANQRIGARQGTTKECSLLNEPSPSPMVTMERLTHDDSGKPAEWAQHVYRASKYEFSITLVVK